MNRKLVFYYLGRITYACGALMILPILVSLIYGEYRCLSAFLLTAIIALSFGFATSHFSRTKDNLMFAKEGFAIVALAWLAMSLLGALPFFISREIPSYVDAFFETVSGFTTTGASILNDVEAMSKSLLFWRSFTHWIGGMGVLVFIMALLPNISERTVHIMRAEVPGPIFGKLVPRVKDTAKILYLIYIALTVLEIILLLLGGMPFFDSVVHSFGTAGTGGFGIKSASIGAYASPYIQWVITIFMLIFGVNFNVYYYFLAKRSISAFKSTELFAYLAVAGASTAAICANIYSLYGSFSESLRHSAFQVSSILTTTGFATTDFNLWPDFSKGVLLVLMFIGGCAGSTAGGLKVSRIILMIKMIGSEIKHLLHPRAVTTVRFEGKKVETETLRSTTVYFVVFAVCYISAFLLISFEPYGFETNFTAVAACINNVGPGFDLVGPSASFSIYSPFSKIVLSVAMLLGRLEIFPLLLTFIPGTWTKD